MRPEKRAYYNEINPFAAEWIRNLIAAGEIPPGDVDERDIKEIRPDDVKGYTQAHFFAGIAGWSLALKYSGWGDRPVWTGSCPCQPLSSIGLRKGHADQRHLWPAFFRLIAECKPSVVFGEQVASALGREWLSGVRTDLETAGYACGAADLPAACVGAPHIRQRLFWVADANNASMPGNDESRPKFIGGSGIFDSRFRVGKFDAFSDYEDIQGRDQKTRRRKPGLLPLVDGVPGRVGRIRAYGNAIVLQVAAMFIKAYMDVE